jgi:hypothetical protein
MENHPDVSGRKLLDVPPVARMRDLPGLFKRGDKLSVRRDLGIATARALQQREFARVYAR